MMLQRIWMTFFSASLLLIASAGNAAAESKPGLQDVLVAHPAGYVSVSYGKGNLAFYSNTLYWQLKQLIAQAESECLWAHQEVDASRVNFLSDKVKAMIDSLKAADGSYSDYLIVSGILRKYAGRQTTSNAPTFSTRVEDFTKTGMIVGVDVRSSGFFAGRCPDMAGAMLGSNDMSKTVLSLAKSDVCSSLNELKSCYRALDSLHASAAQGRKVQLKVVEKGKLDTQQDVKGKAQ
ncbi:MAG: hypothetical protein AB7U75_20195 [Hyphomicrobiaceae bacterium]